MNSIPCPLQKAFCPSPLKQKQYQPSSMVGNQAIVPGHEEKKWFHFIYLVSGWS
jgi:hypothetical protein